MHRLRPCSVTRSCCSTRSCLARALAATSAPARRCGPGRQTLQARIASLRERAREDADLATAITETERELALYARWSASYGYVFYLLRSR
jgi:Na+-translocating ferredoxin:NAD+ oxidoreductase RNF subunit RnfB